MALSCFAITHQYASSSVLSEGSWVKIRVQETGVYCLTYEQLQQAGLKPEKVRVYGYGGAMLSQDFDKEKIDDLPAVPIYMHKGSDGVFNQGDYILFYAQGNISWAWDGNHFVHTRNSYSDYGYYFLSDNAGEQVFIGEQEPLSEKGNTVITSYYDYRLHEQDLLNLVDMNNGEGGGGKEFYGESFQASSPTRMFSFGFNNIVSSDIYGVVDVAAVSSSSSTFTARLGQDAQSVTVRALPTSDQYTKAQTGRISAVFNASTANNQSLSLTYKSDQSSAKGFLNYIELTAQCALSMTSSQLAFRTSTGVGSDVAMQYRLSNANAATQIWNITDRAHIEAVPATLDGTTLSFVGSNQTGVQEYVAVKTDGKDWLTPDIQGRIDNQNLHGLHSIDYVIITPDFLKEEARELALLHERVDGMTWAVVTDQQVYNEFSSGTPDATAYRRLMKMLYDRGVGEQTPPTHLLLFGDGTFDNRKILTRSGNNTLLTYQANNSTIETHAYATDDYFAFMSNTAYINDENGVMEFAVGRLPINTKEQARVMLNKITRYVNNTNLGKWKSQILYLADDGDNGLHTTTAESGAELMRKKNPDFVVNKVYLDAYVQETSASGESYPIAKNRLDNLLSNGVLYMNYSGHGSYNGITNEGMMDIQSIRKMTNANLGFWMLATCSFSHFDSGKSSSAEEALLNENGGAIGVMSACRTVYATQNTIINRNFCDTLFGHKDVYSYDITIGQATRIAKNMTGRVMNKMPYILLGDPALRLAYPTQYHVETTVKPDTVHALSTHEVAGYIRTSDGDTAHWFNGTIDITIFDKMQQITTLDNDETDDSKRVRLTYNDYPNKIFNGSTAVENGVFSFVFMAPKDIRYNYGNGRIVYYAQDPTERAEAIGHEENFIIGGSSAMEIKDTEGPQITLYLNNKMFKNGDDTHENPHFFAEIYDENGINTAGSGIGHDLLLVVDKDPNQTLVLNDYYTSNNGSYQGGMVSYKMNEQSEGQHSLTFRAWDMLNNSNTATLDYNVVKGLEPTIFAVTTYPNPVSSNGVMQVMIDYDRPDEVLQTTVWIYNMQGQMVWTATERDAKTISWNLRDINANGGVYIYKVELKTTDDTYSSRSGKIIVVK